MVLNRRKVRLTDGCCRSFSGLEKLHEILLPDPVSWMPQTIGWYAVFGLDPACRRLVGLQKASTLSEKPVPQIGPGRACGHRTRTPTTGETCQGSGGNSCAAEMDRPFGVSARRRSRVKRREVARLSGQDHGRERFSRRVRDVCLPELAYAPAARIAQLSDEIDQQSPSARPSLDQETCPIQESLHKGFETYASI